MNKELAMITKGTGVIKRRHPKNYIHKQADARLREVVTSYQNQGLEALGVDSFEVKYYHQCTSVQLCTCQQTELPVGKSASTATMTKTNGNADQEIVIDYVRPLFGAVGDSLSAEDESDEDEFALVDDDSGVDRVDSLFSSSADCGICYRSGHIPAFELYGHDRRVLTTFDIADTYGYHKNITTSPHTLVKLDPAQGYVDFVVEVPKYFKGVAYSIRNNTSLLVDEVLVDSTGMPITEAYLRASSGGVALVRYMSDMFTHAVIEFDLGTERVWANLSQASKATDWTMFDTLGNIQIILPMTIRDVAPGDIIHVPSRNTTFKISDEQYLRTAEDRNLDWQVNVRVLQPTEGLNFIHKTLPIR